MGQEWENVAQVSNAAKGVINSLVQHHLALLECSIHAQDDGIREAACCEGLSAMRHFRQRG